MKQVVIKPSDLEKLPPSIRNNPELMKVVDALLANLTKFEEWLGIDFVLQSVPPPQPDPVPEPTPAPEPTPVPAPEQGPRIISIKKRGEDHIMLDTEGCEDWPLEGGVKKTQGKLFVKGVFVDSMTFGQMNGSPKTMENAFGTGEHSLNVRTGEEVEVYVKGHNGKKTAVFLWNWPFRST